MISFFSNFQQLSNASKLLAATTTTFWKEMSTIIISHNWVNINSHNCGNEYSVAFLVNETWMNTLMGFRISERSLVWAQPQHSRSNNSEVMHMKMKEVLQKKLRKLLENPGPPIA